LTGENVAIASEFSDYSSIDPILDDWGIEHGVKFEREHKGWNVRSLWLDRRVQIWIDPKDHEGYFLIHVAELKPSLPSKWGRRVEFRSPEALLRGSLDWVWSIGMSWL